MTWHTQQSFIDFKNKVHTRDHLPAYGHITDTDAVDTDKIRGVMSVFFTENEMGKIYIQAHGYGIYMFYLPHTVDFDGRIMRHGMITAYGVEGVLVRVSDGKWFTTTYDMLDAERFVHLCYGEHRTPDWNAPHVRLFMMMWTVQSKLQHSWSLTCNGGHHLYKCLAAYAKDFDEMMIAFGRVFDFYTADDDNPGHGPLTWHDTRTLSIRVDVSNTEMSVTANSMTTLHVRSKIENDRAVFYLYDFWHNQDAEQKHLNKAWRCVERLLDPTEIVTPALALN